MDPKKKELSWKPVRKGAIYCSPACGHNCTHAAHLLAKERAKELCKLLGAGWTARVWENCGWHYSVDMGAMHLHPHHPTIGKPYYTLFINSGVMAQVVIPAPMRMGDKKVAPPAYDPVMLVQRGRSQFYKMVEVAKREALVMQQDPTERPRRKL